MVWPTVAVVTTNTDASTDSPATARSDLLDLEQKFNQLIAHVVAGQQAALAQVPVLGECRLVWVSTTSVKLTPWNGARLTINNSPEVVPAAGVTLAYGVLTANTRYYIYAYMSGGTMTLEASTTGYTVSSVGCPEKTGDATRTLVGMVYTSGGQFLDNTGNRFTISWWNRRQVVVERQLIANRTASTASYVELNAAERCGFVCWGDDPPMLYGNASGAPSVANDQYFAVSLDSVAPSNGMYHWSSCAVGQLGDHAIGPTRVQAATEGYHYLTAMGRASTGNVTFMAGSTNFMAVFSG